MIYSVTIKLSILFLQKFLHSKRELQHIAFDADSSYFLKTFSTIFMWFLGSIYDPNPGYTVANSKWA